MTRARRCVLGAALTVLNITFNVILIRGLGTDPGVRNAGAAIGTVIASGIVSAVALWMILDGKLVDPLPADDVVEAGLGDHPALFRFGLPAGIQGVAMNIAGVLLLRFIGSLEHSAEAQAAYAVGYAELFSLITWTSVGLMGAAAAVAGQNLGAGHPERSEPRVSSRRARSGSASRLHRRAVPADPRASAGHLRYDAIRSWCDLGTELLRFLSVSGLFITVALTYTGGLQGTGDTRSPLFITLISQVLVPLGICFTLQAMGTLQLTTVWTRHPGSAISPVRPLGRRFQQGKWRNIAVEFGSQLDGSGSRRPLQHGPTIGEAER